MIKANELRIGNRVWESNSFTPGPEDFDEIIIASINDIDKVVCDNQGNGYSYDALYPIPLTPEWLERFGFKKTMFVYPGDPKTEAVEAFVKGKFVIRWIDFGSYASWRTEHFPYPQSQNIIPGDMRYVHQLQNNYYCWTNGEELAITQPVL